MTQFTCKGVKQINNRISFKHLYHSYLSAFFVSTGVPNREFPEILIAKCRSRFYCTWFFCWGEIMREINVSRAGDPVHAGDKALTRETPAQRGRVNRYAQLLVDYFSQSVTRSNSFDWQNTQENDSSVITAHQSTKRLTLALGIFKLRRITWPFL
jgi:hypothetical protein